MGALSERDEQDTPILAVQTAESVLDLLAASSTICTRAVSALFLQHLAVLLQRSPPDGMGTETKVPCSRIATLPLRTPLDENADSCEVMSTGASAQLL